jgi:hypothetical protein
MKIVNALQGTLLAGVAALVGGGVTSSLADEAGMEARVGELRDAHQSAK